MLTANLPRCNHRHKTTTITFLQACRLCVSKLGMNFFLLPPRLTTVYEKWWLEDGDIWMHKLTLLSWKVCIFLLTLFALIYIKISFFLMSSEWTSTNYLSTNKYVFFQLLLRFQVVDYFRRSGGKGKRWFLKRDFFVAMQRVQVFTSCRYFLVKGHTS